MGLNLCRSDLSGAILNDKTCVCPGSATAGCSTVLQREQAGVQTICYLKLFILKKDEKKFCILYRGGR